MLNYKNIILEALKKVVSEEGYSDFHEQALTHRLAFYLESSGYFPDFVVDCEYNRHGTDTKKFNNIEFRADITIHTRKTDLNNLIMIEAKKFNTSKSSLEKLKTRLILRNQKYKYDHLYIVIYPQASVIEDCVIEIN